MIQITLNEVKKSYSSQDRFALSDVDLTILRGEFVAIMGRSGSGKTTLLNIMSTIDTIDSGSVLCGDVNLKDLTDSQAAEFRKNEIGFVFQDYMLLDSLTVRENIAVVLSLKGENSKEIDDKINQYASSVDMYDQLDKYPYQLSGGQKQRVSIIRAIIKEPKILFADEPTGALDLKSSQMIMETLVKINKAYNITIVMVTHDVLSASYADKAYILKDGRIADTITKEEVTNFYDSINFSLSKVGE